MNVTEVIPSAARRAKSRDLPRLATTLSCVLVVLLSAASAHASPLFETVGGVGGGGFNARFATPSAASSYFNPALLPRAPTGFHVGYMGFQDAITLTLGGRFGVDVPLSQLNSGPQRPTYPTLWHEEGCSDPGQGSCLRALAANPRQAAGTSGTFRHYTTLGLVNQVAGERLVLGAYAVLPLGDFTGGDQFFVDEREQFFSNSLHPEMYGDRMSAPSFAIGVGSQLVDVLAVGVTFSLSLKNVAQADTYVFDGNDQANTLELSTEVGVIVNGAPHFSLTFTPSDAISISAIVHSPSQFRVDVGLSTLLVGGDNQNAERIGTLDYMPWQIALGGEFDLPSREGRRVTLTGGAILRTWSSYVDRQSDTPEGSYAWSNTVTPSIGARWEEDPLRFGLDLTYVPTPVPLQTGRTNYVDNDRFGVSGSVAYDFEVAEMPLRLGLDFQWNRVFSRTQNKVEPDTTPGSEDPSLVLDEYPDDATDLSTGDPIAEARGLQTNNPGYPGFQSEGYTWGAGVSFSIMY